MSRTMLICTLIMLFAGFLRAESHLMRFADVSETYIVFTCEEDLWLVPLKGGEAKRITRGQGEEIFAKFSPDGSRLAFTANYDGGTDVYVMDSEGSAPKRLTWYPGSDFALDWFPDGKQVLFRSRRDHNYWAYTIYKVSTEGGMPEKLPVDRAGLASLSPNAESVAYNRIAREFRNWKRYTGGMAQDIWVGSFAKGDFDRITTWKGSDNFPMWSGDAIYFTSDREDSTLNLYKYNLMDKSATRLTFYDDYDVKYPSIGPDHIVFQYAEKLHLFNLADQTVTEVPITISSDEVLTRTDFIDVKKYAGSFGLSPKGVRAILDIRGEIISIPVEDGIVYNLSQTSGSREKNPVWSPDGKQVAFISDKTGEEELYLTDAAGGAAWKQLTKGGEGFRERPKWSPDGKYLIFHDKAMRLNLVNAITGAIDVIDRGDYDDGWYTWGIQDYDWSPDSRWVAYAKLERSMYQSIFIYSVAEKKSWRVTGSMTQDWSPSFSKDGRYLYFLSNRTFNPIMGFVDQNHIFRDLTRPYIVLLKESDASPFRPKNEFDDTAEEEHPSRADNVLITLDGFENRTLPAPGKASDLFRLEAGIDGFYYLEKTEDEFIKYQYVADDNAGTNLNLHYFSLAEAEDNVLMTDISQYHLSGDGSKIIYKSGNTYGVVDSKCEAKVGDGELNLSDVYITINRRDEFLQIFNEAWRVQRDWFYDRNMHGVNWEKAGKKYRRFIPWCSTRDDVNYLIGEMIAELNIGHTYIYGGDLPSFDRTRTGYLGAEFEGKTDSYPKITKIIPGSNWDDARRSPFEEPGCPIKVGHYLTGVDGFNLQPGDNIYKYLQNKPDDVVELSYNDKPQIEGSKKYLVKTITSQGTILYDEYVNGNREKVDRMTNGDVGYLHIPSMDEDGLTEFARAFYPQYYKKGIIIDVRNNGGGFTSKMIIDRLERKMDTFDQPREGKPAPIPERAFMGHLVLLIDQDTGSDGEIFSETWKSRGFGPIIGLRTWGGAVGIEAHQPLIDGAVTTPPQFGEYNSRGEWIIEGIGVIPDIEVWNMPGDVLKGKDAQLERAVAEIQKMIEAGPKTPEPERPAYPDKSKPTLK